MAAEQPADGHDQDDARFTSLPDRVRPAEVSATQRAHPVSDPEQGRDADRDSMLRNAG